MDYRAAELTRTEKIRFRTFMLMFGIMIGHLFYDSIFAGMIAGTALFAAERPYRQMILQKRKQVLAMQF